MPTLNNYPVNRTDFRVIRGVQNEVLFFIRDLDRNPVATTTFQNVTMYIVDPYSNTLVLTKSLTIVNPATALYMLRLLSGETVGWETGTLRWSIQVVRQDGSSFMLWTDNKNSPYSFLEVTEGPVPVPAGPVVLIPAEFTISNGVAYSGALPGAAQIGYQNGLHTLAVYPFDFTGSIQVDASLHSEPGDNDWFAVMTENYLVADELTTVNITGNYLWMRLAITTISGSIVQILYKN